ncbi:MAG: hypothetical protein MJ225_02955 [Bacilli bacterium]|nr:hypothetical protein [Bacilli bacterium]
MSTQKRKFTLYTIIAVSFSALFVVLYSILFKNNLNFAFAEPFKTLGNFIVANIFEVITIVVTYGLVIFLFAHMLVLVTRKKYVGLKVGNVLLFLLGTFVATYLIHGFYTNNFIENFKHSIDSLKNGDAGQGTLYLLTPIVGLAAIVFIILANCYSNIIDVSEFVTETEEPLFVEPPLVEPTFAPAYTEANTNTQSLEQQLYDALSELKLEYQAKPQCPNQRLITIIPTNLSNQYYQSVTNSYGEINPVTFNFSVPNVILQDTKIWMKK